MRNKFGENFKGKLKGNDIVQHIVSFSLAFFEFSKLALLFYMRIKYFINNCSYKWLSNIFSHIKCNNVIVIQLFAEILSLNILKSDYYLCFKCVNVQRVLSFH